MKSRENFTSRAGFVISCIGAAVGLAGVFMFYNVVVGWIIKYLSLRVSGNIKNIDIPNCFDSFADAITIGVSPLAALLVFIVFYYMYSKEQVLEEINRATIYIVM
jgi:NSS family neurotransmitter:Na+ symporter